MSERIDHAVMADLCLDEAAHSIGLDEFAYADIRVKAAQVHATLALVEQQRISNLIAYIAKWTDGEVLDVDVEIREALGR